MASVQIRVSDRAIITALNTPGGAVHEWRDNVGVDVRDHAFRHAPVNDPLNAMHRGGDVGVYKASFGFDRLGSSGHHVVARVTNSAAHAIYVELGRSASYKMQIFSWSAYGGAVVRTGGPNRIENRPNRRGRTRKLSARAEALNSFVDKLPPRVGRKTADRAGEHILSKALVAVMGSQGISARTDL